MHTRPEKKILVRERVLKNNTKTNTKIPYVLQKLIGGFLNSPGFTMQWNVKAVNHTAVRLKETGQNRTIRGSMIDSPHNLVAGSLNFLRDRKIGNGRFQDTHQYNTFNLSMLSFIFKMHAWTISRAALSQAENKQKKINVRITTNYWWTKANELASER